MNRNAEIGVWRCLVSDSANLPLPFSSLYGPSTNHYVHGSRALLPNTPKTNKFPAKLFGYHMDHGPQLQVYKTMDYGLWSINNPIWKQTLIQFYQLLLLLISIGIPMACVCAFSSFPLSNFDKKKLGQWFS